MSFLNMIIGFVVGFYVGKSKLQPILDEYFEIIGNKVKSIVKSWFKKDK